MGLHIGIDLGGTNVRVASVLENGEVDEMMQEPTEAEQGPKYTIEKIIRMIESVAGDQAIEGIGIGAPGPLDPHRGVILAPPNLPGWDEVPIVDHLKNHFQTTVKLNNDANAAALAEARFGGGKGYESVFYITVSTGVGGGLVINGRVFNGAQGYAGEIGNMILNPHGYQYSNLNKGALESYSSGTAIAERFSDQFGKYGAAEDVFELVSQGNEKAQRIVDEAIDYLAMGIANITHIINPEVFVVGGGVMNAGELIWVPLRDRLEDYVYPGLVEHIHLEPAALSGEAGVIGAALLTQQ